MFKGLYSSWDDVVLLAGVRTPFVDYGGAVGLVSPTDLGIKAARAVLSASGTASADVGIVIAGSVAQASFDAYMLPRHIGLYSGVPVDVPAHLVQRVCGTGIEALIQGADAIAHKDIDVALCVGTESMSRNPVAAYTHRNGFRLGQVEFKDFLWESLRDPAPDVTMGGTAENLAKAYQITRHDADVYAARSFDRALQAQSSGFFDEEIIPLCTESFEQDCLQPRGMRLTKAEKISHDTHVRVSPLETLAKIPAAFGGVQTGGNSSAIVDGAAAAVLCRQSRLVACAPLAFVRAATVVGVRPDIMGIGPAPAISHLLERSGLQVDDIDRIEINEAFAAQVIACVRELGLDESKLNVNGGAIAIGHPLAATGVRLSTTLARELDRIGGRFGIASACIGGGQGIAILLEAYRGRGRAA